MHLTLPVYRISMRNLLLSFISRVMNLSSLPWCALAEYTSASLRTARYVRRYRYRTTPFCVLINRLLNPISYKACECIRWAFPLQIHVLRILHARTTWYLAH
ncbi:hypothetical protein F4818DRAFT_404433 [Hypoxylon cercidicola]|nr:hypothetical protein F4818DRAFT_404433 [Hypoxylon cercidicola]